MEGQQPPNNQATEPPPRRTGGFIPPSEKANPDPDQTPILKLDGNITVRAHRATDAAPMAALANSLAISGRMRNRFAHPYTLENAQNFINTMNDHSTWAERGPFDPATQKGTGELAPCGFAICIDDEFVGNIGFNFKEDVEVRCAEMGYWIGEPYWGRGIMGRVAPAVVAWAWETYGRLLRLEGEVFEGNPASCRVLEKCGMKKVLRKEKAVYKRGKVLAVDVFEMVREGDE